MSESAIDDVMIECPKCNGTSDFNCCYTCAGTGRLPNPVFVEELARLREVNTDLRKRSLDAYKKKQETSERYSEILDAMEVELTRITAINTDLRQQLAVARAERDEARATDQNSRAAYMKMIVITKELQSEIVDLEHELAMSKAEVERLTPSNETENFSTDSHKIDFSPSTPQAPRFQEHLRQKDIGHDDDF